MHRGFWRAAGAGRVCLSLKALSPHSWQVQNLMARAEYLKDQVKVGTWGAPTGAGLCGCCSWLSIPCSLTNPPAHVSFSGSLSGGISIAFFAFRSQLLRGYGCGSCACPWRVSPLVHPLCSTDEGVSLGS